MSTPDTTAAECAIIGSILIDNSVVAEISEKVSPEDFFGEGPKRIYSACLELDRAGMPIDLATLYTRLSGDPQIKELGGIAYIANMVESVPSPIMAPRYAQLVHDDALRRKIMAFAAELQCKTSQQILDIKAFASETTEALRQIIDDAGVTSFVELKMAFKDAFSELTEITENGGKVVGIETGFVDLDKIVSGLRPGSLTIIAARPAMGKTAFALNILSNVAIRKSTPSAIFSLEMTSVELAMRILSSMSGVNGNLLRRAELNTAQWESVMRAAEKYAKAPLFIDDSSGITISALRDRARRLKATQDIKFIVVDYLQLLTSGSKKVLNREQEVADIARGLKALAKELSVPVVALAQLNRAVESRTDKRPFLSDLRESGSIEQDADNIMFIHRPAYYDREAKPGEDTKAEIIVAKQRNGATGLVNLHWDASTTQFSNLETQYSDEECQWEF